MLTSVLAAAAWLIRGVFRLIISFIKAIAYFYVALLIGGILLFGVIAVLSPLGETVAIGGAVILLVLAPQFWDAMGPETMAYLRTVFAVPLRSRPQTEPSSSPEAEDPAPSLPAVPAPEHVPGATSIYRGRLTTLPPA